MLRSFSVVFALLCQLMAPAAAQDAPRSSECLAMSQAPPRITPVSLRSADARTDQVAITFAGHSTYYIDTPGGVRIATDFSGSYTTGRLPDVVTMNRAHSTHYSLFPDSRIPYVLHGWGDDGQPAKIAQRIGYAYIRNGPLDGKAFLPYIYPVDNETRHEHAHRYGQRPSHVTQGSIGTSGGVSRRKNYRGQAP